MASEEQNNRQQQFNDFLEREIELRAENQRFLGETLSISSQLQDKIEFQLNQLSQRLTLDKEILKSSRDNINVVKRLSDNYQSINDIQKDQQKIQKQISSNLTVITAKSKDLNKEDLKAARAYVDREKAINASTEAISGMINEQEKMEAQFQAQEDAGRALTEEQIGQRIGLKAKLDAERFLTGEKIKQQEEAKKSLSNEALSVELLKDQNEELKKGDEYLTKEENKLLAIVKAQGLWNSSLGAVEGILKKAGAGGAAIALGLERGKAEAEEMAKQLTDFGNEQDLGFIRNIGIELKVLGAGIKGTFMGMADSLKAISFGAILVGAFKKGFKLIGGPLVTGFISDLKGKFTEGISYLKEQFFSLNSYIEDVKVGDQLRLQLSQATADLATDLGVGTAEAKKLTEESRKIGREIGMLPEELAKTTAELNKAFGTTQKFSQDTVKTMGQLTHQFGLTNEEASEFVKLSKLSGKETSDFTLETKTRVQSLKEASNIAISEKEVMQEIAKASSSLQLSSRAQGKNLADAAFHAKKLGLSLAQTEAIGSNLLDLESSIASEMEAELLIGRDLNLDKARQFALNKDVGGVAKEIAKQMGSAAAFGDLNVIQQEALAKSIGVSADELGNMLSTQELLAGTGFDDMSQAQKQFRDLLKKTGSEEAALAKMREDGASKTLTDQIRVKSAQEERVLQEREIANQQMAMAIEAGKLFTAFLDVKKQVKEIKKIVVDQMGPFFDSFAGLIGDGGDVFQNKVLPYAKQLGKFMNDVGLRLIDIVKNNGPAMSSIFSGVLDLFGSIYNVVGGVVKQLLGINNASATSSSFFESINDTIQSMVEKLKNVDISALTEKIRGFIQGVKDTFTAVKEGIMKAVDLIQNSALGKFLSGNAGSTSLAIAPLAFKGFKASGLFKRGNSKSMPMFVQDVNGGGMMDMAGSMRGGRAAGIGGGFKKGFKGLMDYAKMAFKGGRAGKVGRARIARAAKGLITGQGASFVGGAGRGTAQAASRLGGIAGKLGSLGKGLGKLAAGGGIGAIVGLAAEASLGHFQKKAEEAAASMEEGEAKEKKLSQARNLSIASTTAKYAGLGATIGSVIPGVGTAVGAAIGGFTGLVVGLQKAQEARKFQTSAEGKFQSKYRKQLLKNAKLNQAIETTALKLKLQSERDSAIASLNVQKEFSEKLKGIDLNVPLDGVNENFQTLAQNMLDAGNITEEQFTAAINGTITPLDLMNAASTKAANNLTELYDVVGKAAQEQAKAAETVVESQLGTNKAILEAEQKLIDSYASNAILLEQNSENLFKEFGKQLTAGIFDTGAAAALTGSDSDVGTGFVDALSAMLEKETGQDQKAISTALAGVAAQLEKDGDFDLDSQEDILKLQQLVAERLNQGVDTQAKAVENAGLKAEKLGQEFGLKYTNSINEITKSQLEGSKELKGAISSLEGGTELLANAMADGALSTSELDDLKKFLVAGGTALAAGGDDEALANLTKIFEGAETADDFILRPGQPVLKFNKDDLVMGGTNLEGNNENASLSTEKLEQELQDLKQIMSGFVEQMSQVVNRPITVELNGNKVGQALGQDSYRIQ
jgi:hypothetical protein